MAKFINELNYDKKPYDSFDKNPAKIGYVNDVYETLYNQIVAQFATLQAGIKTYNFTSLGELTGTTDETVVGYFTIPANTLGNEALTVKLGFAAPVAGCTYRLYANNTSNEDTVDAAALAVFSSVPTTSFSGMERTFKVNNGSTLIGMNELEDSASDLINSTGAPINVTIDPSLPTYILVTFELGADTDVASVMFGTLTAVGH